MNFGRIPVGFIRPTILPFSTPVCWKVKMSCMYIASGSDSFSPSRKAGVGAVGFFGARYDRATPAEREYLQGMAELAEGRDEPVTTSALAQHLGRKPSSLSPARDSLLRKGLVFSAERGWIAFTVPHFGRFLLGRD